MTVRIIVFSSAERDTSTICTSDRDLRESHCFKCSSLMDRVSGALTKTRTSLVEEGDESVPPKPGLKNRNKTEKWLFTVAFWHGKGHRPQNNHRLDHRNHHHGLLFACFREYRPQRRILVQAGLLRTLIFGATVHHDGRGLGLISGVGDQTFLPIKQEELKWSY